MAELAEVAEAAVLLLQTVGTRLRHGPSLGLKVSAHLDFADIALVAGLGGA
jgi:hypothetical protein